jgi:NAD(P)-dependent dehydrogenase (short-subunit alcohol dehydrogenase family)
VTSEATGQNQREQKGPVRQPVPPFPEQHQESPGVESELSPAPRYQAELYKPAGKLNGKVALITGGDSGIGRAVALLYAREGAQVAINYLEEEQEDADVTVSEIRNAGGNCIQIPGDLSDAGFCSRLVDETVEKLGALDILVSNAAHQSRKPLKALTDQELEYTFSINVFAYVRLARAALKHMKPGAVIIATSSETGILGSKELPDYSATKGAINAFTKTLAQALVSKGIRVNAIAPGPVWTPLNPSDPGLPPERVAKFGASNPMGRPAQPEELAPAYVFLGSNADASYITGTVIQIMGGEPSGG